MLPTNTSLAPPVTGSRDPQSNQPAPPEELREKYVDWSWMPVSHYSPHSIAYRLVRGIDVRFAKITGPDWTPSAAAEGERLRWASTQPIPVPKVVDAGLSGGLSWIVTEALPGRDATDPQIRSDPHSAVGHLAQGLRRFHELPWKACPFSFRLRDSLALAGERLRLGRIDPTRDFHEEHAHLSAAAAVASLERRAPRDEDLVVCHGDYCAPNILIEEDKVVGYVDLGELGVADRWWDLAVATWSVEWNYGPGLEGEFLAAYGIEPDVERIRYYRLLYDVVS